MSHTQVHGGWQSLFAVSWQEERQINRAMIEKNRVNCRIIMVLIEKCNAKVQKKMQPMRVCMGCIPLLKLIS